MQTTVARELEWGTKGSEKLPRAEGRGGSTGHGPPRTFLLESTRPPRLSHRAMSSGQCPGARKIARQNAAVRCKKCPAYWPACGTAVACSQDTIKEFRCLRPHITIRDQVLFPTVHMSFPGTFETNGVPREGPLVVPGRPADIVEGPPLPYSFLVHHRQLASPCFGQFLQAGPPASIPSIMHARMEWSDQQNALIGLRRDAAKPLERIPVM